MNWIHLHLALNHIPVLGTLFIAMAQVQALATGNDRLLRASLAWFTVLAVCAIPIKFTGDFAYELTADAAWMDNARAEAHEQAADQATTAIFLLGLLAAVGLFASRGGRAVPRWVSGASLLAALITFGLMARTANLGGQLRHEEIRPQPDVVDSAPDSREFLKSAAWQGPRNLMPSPDVSRCKRPTALHTDKQRC